MLFDGNIEQKQAYHSSGNCVVLAGPGSGKTYTLTHKLAKTIKEEVLPPRKVACITYSKQCVRDLKRKLQELGLQSGKQTVIGTVHSFCLQHIILPYAHLTSISVPSPFKVGSEKEIKIVQQQAFDNCGVNYYWTSRIDYHRRVYLDRSSSDWIERDEEAARLIEEYERLLLELGFVDYDWIVLTSLKMIKENVWIRKALAARFPVIFVDEYQDLGLALHELVKILCLDAGIRIVAVGDPDQSIYGFSGAKPELIKELSVLSGFETVALKLNYRCGTNIIKVSEITLGESRGCVSNSGELGGIYFHRIKPDLAAQAQYACANIISGIFERNSNIALGDIGVFYLDKFDGDVIANEVSATGWDFIRVDGNSPYQPSPVTYWLEECAAWCAGGWRGGIPSLSGIVQQWLIFNESLVSDMAARKIKINLVEFLSSHKNPEQDLHTWLDAFISSCLQKTLVNEPRLNEDKDKVLSLLKLTAPGCPLSRMTVSSFAGQGRSPSHLNLTTLHSAKGLEFGAVIMLGLEEGRIPWTSDRDGTLNEKRRLFYVGLTRAKQEIHFVYSGQYTDRRGRIWNNGRSRFLNEIASKISNC